MNGINKKLVKLAQLINERAFAKAAVVARQIEVTLNSLPDGDVAIDNDSLAQVMGAIREFGTPIA